MCSLERRLGRPAARTTGFAGARRSGFAGVRPTAFAGARPSREQWAEASAGLVEPPRRLLRRNAESVDRDHELGASTRLPKQAARGFRVDPGQLGDDATRAIAQLLIRRDDVDHSPTIDLAEPHHAGGRD